MLRQFSHALGRLQVNSARLNSLVSCVVCKVDAKTFNNGQCTQVYSMTVRYDEAHVYIDSKLVCPRVMQQLLKINS